MGTLRIKQRAAILLICLLGTLNAAAQEFETGTVSIQDFIGSVEIKTRVPADDPDGALDETVRVQIRQGKKFHDVDVIKDGERIVIYSDARTQEDLRDCCNDKIRREVHLRKDRKLTTGKPVDEDYFSQYPTLILTMPETTNLSFIDTRMKLEMGDLTGRLDLDACYAYGTIGNLEEASIAIISGSRLTVGDISAGIEIDLSGDADIKIGDASIADIDIAGPGDVIAGDIEGILDISIAGSGLVRAQRVAGSMMVRVAGSGGAVVDAGKADRLKAIIDGSGGVLFDGHVSNPDLRLYGSSEVRLASTQGRITHHGSGELYIGGKLYKKRPAPSALK